MFVPQEILTAHKCALHIIVRGLVRVRCVQEMDRVLNFMTRKGLINTGVLSVTQPLLPDRYRSVSPHLHPPPLHHSPAWCSRCFSNML